MQSYTEKGPAALCPSCAKNPCECTHCEHGKRIGHDCAACDQLLLLAMAAVLAKMLIKSNFGTARGDLAIIDRFMKLEERCR